MKTIKIYFHNAWKCPEVFMIKIEILPTIDLFFYHRWSFESVRIAWLGFEIGLTREI